MLSWQLPLELDCWDVQSVDVATSNGAGTQLYRPGGWLGARIAHKPRHDRPGSCCSVGGVGEIKFRCGLASDRCPYDRVFTEHDRGECLPVLAGLFQPGAPLPAASYWGIGYLDFAQALVPVAIE